MSYKHGMNQTRIYGIWEDMKSRCNNPNNIAFKYYGGRGIKVTDLWGDFINFYNWAISSGYEDLLTIDRINTNGNYEPSNCRWATKTEQARNQRKTIFITHNGKTKPLTEWCEILKLKSSTVHERIRKGFPEECLLLPPWELKKPQYQKLKRFQKERIDYQIKRKGEADAI